MHSEFVCVQTKKKYILCMNFFYVHHVILEIKILWIVLFIIIKNIYIIIVLIDDILYFINIIKYLQKKIIINV